MERSRGQWLLSVYDLTILDEGPVAANDGTVAVDEKHVSTCLPKTAGNLSIQFMKQGRGKMSPMSWYTVRYPRKLQIYWLSSKPPRWILRIL
jgi:hypothetical protein